MFSVSRLYSVECLIIVERLVELELAKEAEILRKNLSQYIYVLQISHDLTWNRSQAAAVGS
jgi:hypothetical protein